MALALPTGMSIEPVAVVRAEVAVQLLRLIRDGVEGFVIEPRDVAQILDKLEAFAGMSAADFAGFKRRARARYEEVCLPDSVGKVIAGHYAAILAGRGRVDS